jgi:hypothetical protein
MKNDLLSYIGVGVASGSVLLGLAGTGGTPSWTSLDGTRLKRQCCTGNSVQQSEVAMTTKITSRRHWVALLAALVLLSGAGCQTFNMSQEDFEKQQHGEVVDPVGAHVAEVVGTLAALGIMIGEIVAQTTKN